MSDTLDDAPVIALRAALIAALGEECEGIMADSKEHYCPVDEGILRGSGHVSDPDDRGDEVIYTLAYGGPAEAYAVPQHERLDYQHRVGEAKYLERPLLAKAAGLDERIAARAKAKTGQ